MEEHVVSQISIKALWWNYRYICVCSWRAVWRYKAACVWIKGNSQSLGENFKVKRKSRLIRCTLWALFSAAFTTFNLCFPVIDQACLLSVSWKRRKAEWEKRSDSWGQVLDLQTIQFINQSLCVAPTHKHVFARTSQAFYPLGLRVSVCEMRVGLTSKSKFVLVKKPSSFL